MSTIVEFNLESRKIRVHGQSASELRSGDEDLIWWFDLDRSDRDSFDEIAKRFAIPGEEMRLLTDEDPQPGLVERENSLTLTLRAWSSTGPPDVFTLYLAKNFCMTLARPSLPCLRELRQTYSREFRYAQSPGFLLFLILDSLVEEYAHGMAPLEDESERIGDHIYEDFDPDINKDILKLKRSVLSFKRAITQTRDDLMRLSGRRIPVITESCRQSLGDVYNHAHALTSSLDSLRDLVSSLLDSYMAVQAQTLNENMKILTIFASLVLPMTLIAGIYGMNFKIMPELGWDYGYLVALCLMGLSGLGSFAYFKRKGWV